MTADAVLSGLTPDLKQNWEEVILAFASSSDTELADIIEKLPVSDILAIDTDYIKGEYFIEFSKIMKLSITYEKLIRKSLYACIPILEELLSSEGEKVPVHYAKDIRWNLLCAQSYWLELQRRRASFSRAVPGAPKIDVTEAVRYSVTDPPADTVLGRVYPKTVDLLGAKLREKAVQAAMAELNLMIVRSNVRLNTLRRREFRKAIIRNHQATFTEFLEGHGSSWRLHETKLDRIVVDIYHPDLFTHDELVKSAIYRSDYDIRSDLDKSRIPTEAFIDAIRQLSSEDGRDIDALVSDFEKRRSDGLREGYSQAGTVVMETDIGKLIFTYKPYKSGAPIRLRIITNVQNQIRRELFDEFPGKEELYREHTWSSGSELNFIMPEDYEYYLSHEASVCNWIEYTGRELFHDLIEEHLGISASKLTNLIVYVSQWEVCYEVPFQQRKCNIPLIKRNFKSPSLTEYLFAKFSEYQRYANTYANFKIEKTSMRPSFYLDISSLDPTLPIMQYKVYPKYRNLKNRVMIRHEITPTKFTKFVGGEEGDGGSLSELVLSSPAYCREMIERYLQFELHHNGVNGQGYNSRYREVPEDEIEQLWMAVVRAAIFGKKSNQYGSRFQAMIDTGKLPSGISRTYRDKMLSLGILSKKKRGVYLLSEKFQRAILRLRSET